METAIRIVDSEGKGGLDLDEFKQFLFNLDYLHFMHVDENRQDKSEFIGLDYENQNTAKGMVI